MAARATRPTLCGSRTSPATARWTGCASTTSRRSPSSRRRTFRADADRGAGGARHRRPDPVRAAPRRVPLQLLARRGQPARAVAAHHAGELPHRRARLGRADRRRRAGRAEDENWVWAGADVIEPDYTLALVSLSRGGADAAVVREFDMRDTRIRRRTGSSCPRPRPRSAGRTRTPCWSAPTSATGSLTDSGYPRLVKRWRRGQPLADAETRVRGRATDVDRRRIGRPDARVRAHLASAAPSTSSTTSSTSCAAAS